MKIEEIQQRENLERIAGHFIQGNKTEVRAEIIKQAKKSRSPILASARIVMDIAEHLRGISQSHYLSFRAWVANDL